MEATQERLEQPQEALDVFYMKMVAPNCDARTGKLAPGKIVPLARDKALRWLTAGVAVQTTRAEYEEQNDRKAERASAAQNAYRALNEGGSIWDVSTYRDVLTASEQGLRLAYEAGVPLVNVHVLRNDDGHPIAPDADIEEILDARDNLHPDMVSPYAMHERSSVMGGGSPYGDVQPLSPQHRATMQRIAEQEKMAQRPASFSYTAPDSGAQSRRQNSPPGSERNGRADRRSRGRQAGTVSSQGLQEATDQGLTPPKPASGEQVGNAPDDKK